MKINYTKHHFLKLMYWMTTQTQVEVFLQFSTQFCLQHKGCKFPRALILLIHETDYETLSESHTWTVLLLNASFSTSTSSSYQAQVSLLLIPLSNISTNTWITILHPYLHAAFSFEISNQGKNCVTATGGRPSQKNTQLQWQCSVADP